MNRLIAFLIVALPLGGCASHDLQTAQDAVGLVKGTVDQVNAVEPSRKGTRLSDALGKATVVIEGAKAAEGTEGLEAAGVLVGAVAPVLPPPYGAYAGLAASLLVGLGGLLKAKREADTARMVVKSIAAATTKDADGNKVVKLDDVEQPDALKNVVKTLKLK